VSYVESFRERFRKWKSVFDVSRAREVEALFQEADDEIAEAYDKGVNETLKSGAAGLTDWARGMLDNFGAANYVQLGVSAGEKGYTVLIQNLEGKTPAEVLDEVVAERDEFRRVNGELHVSLSDVRIERDKEIDRRVRAENERDEAIDARANMRQERNYWKALHKRQHERENHDSITKWQRETFGLVTDRVAFLRARKEWRELQDKVDNLPYDINKVSEEIADVAITLHRLASALGHNLDDDIDAKMAINRSREWVLNGDGTGQHKPNPAGHHSEGPFR
jgi:hypothetical protein